MQIRKLMYTLPQELQKLKVEKRRASTFKVRAAVRVCVLRLRHSFHSSAQLKKESKEEKKPLPAHARLLKDKELTGSFKAASPVLGSMRSRRGEKVCCVLCVRAWSFACGCLWGYRMCLSEV